MASAQQHNPVTRLLTSQPLFFLLPLEVVDATPEFYSDQLVHARVIPRHVDLAIGTPGTAILQHAHDQLKTQRNGDRPNDSVHPFGAVLLAMARKVDSSRRDSNASAESTPQQPSPTLAYGIVRLENHGRIAVPEYDAMTIPYRSLLTVMGCKLKVRPGDEISRPLWMNLVKSPPWRPRMRKCRAVLQMAASDIERRLRELGHYTQTITLHLFEDRMDHNGRPEKKAPTKQPNLPPCWMPETVRHVNDYLKEHVLPAMRRWFDCSNKSPEEQSHHPKFTLGIFGRNSTRFWNTELSHAERESVYRVTTAVSNYINWQYRRTCTAARVAASDPMSQIVQKFLDDYTVQHFDSSIDGYTAQDLHPAMNALLQCVTVPGTFSRPYMQVAQIIREACRVRSSPNVSGVDVLLSSPLELNCTVSNWPEIQAALNTRTLAVVGSLPLLHWVSGLLVKAMLDSILASELLRKLAKEKLGWRDLITVLVQNQAMPVDFTQMRFDLLYACDVVASVLEQTGTQYQHHSASLSRWQQQHEFWNLVESMFRDIRRRTKSNLTPEHVGGFEHNWLLIAQCLLKYARFFINVHVNGSQMSPPEAGGWASIACQISALWFSKESVLQHFVVDVFDQLKTARNHILNRFILQYGRLPPSVSVMCAEHEFSDLSLATLGSSGSSTTDFPTICTAVKMLRKHLWSDNLPALWFNPFRFDQDYRRILSPELTALLNRLASYTTTVWTMDGMIVSEPFASCTLASSASCSSVQPVTIDDCPFMDAYRKAIDGALGQSGGE